MLLQGVYMRANNCSEVLARVQNGVTQLEVSLSTGEPCDCPAEQLLYNWYTNVVVLEAMAIGICVQSCIGDELMLWYVIEQ